MGNDKRSENTDTDDFPERDHEKVDLTGDESAGNGSAADSVDRRSFLKVAGTATAAAIGFSGSAAAATTVEGIEFDRVVNGVEDLGMDPEGNDYVHTEIEEALSQSGTLLELPPGTYRVPGNGHTPSVTVSSNRVGIRGTGDARGDVRFVTDQGQYARWLNWSGSDFLLSNLVFDQYDSFDTMLGALLSPNGGACKIVGCGLEGSEPSQRSVGGFSQNRDPMLFQFVNSGGHIVVQDWVDLTPVQYDDYPNNRAMFWGAAGATGSAEFRDMWVRGGSGSVIYFGKDRMAPIEVANCHFRHVHDKAVRVTGSETTIRNCTWWYDDTQWHPDSHVRGGGTPSQASTRSLWAQTNSSYARAGPTVENCHVKVDNLQWGDGGMHWNRYTSGGTVRNSRFELNAGGAAVRAGSGSSTVTVENSAFTGSSGTVASGGGVEVRRVCNSLDGSGSGCAAPEIPEEFPGESVSSPDSGSGSEDGSGSDTLDRTLTVESTGEARASYEFSVTEALEAGSNANTSNAEYLDAVDGTTGSGSVALYGTDDYRFAGELESAVVDGPANVFVDGEQVETEAPEPEPTPKTLELTSTGEARATYEVAVTGGIEAGDRANTSNAEYLDEVGDSTASGSVAVFGTDDYEFTGELESVVVDGPAAAYVDGEQVETQAPSEETDGSDGDGEESNDDGQTAEPTKTLEVSSTGSARATYEFTVTGEIEAGDRANTSNADFLDEISGSTASGSVALYGTDDYEFTGELDSIDVDGPAEVYVDGTITDTGGE
ncbi:right-handed parallel beta-helix repeat-containing protein [Halostella salina]|uniref:right-handed parallel beta-helix repeat-containing protein n=1 Tax=Halostella salina TaxID=1547897 RepID=UPI000EF7E7E8|nr:right-handed parallel beta-helix repeat-containing protein [Halostella salina]